MTLQSLSELIEAEAKQFKLPQKPASLYDPIAYILKLGGKRVRPILVLIGYSLYKNDPQRITQEALSVEVFHNFTLMHDDIMDNAHLRRGEPTVHEKWDQTTAILSGDAMLIKAYQLLEGLESEMLAKSFRLFNKCALEVCEGQQLDMDLESANDVSVEEYLEMIRLKTAVLVGYSLQFGGLLAGVSEAEQNRLHALGVSMGLAFQLMDDHLDTFGNVDFGKQIGGDILANKKTFLLISALQSKSKDELSQWLAKEANAEKIKTFTQIMRDEGVDKSSIARIKAYSSEAISLLSEIEGKAESKALLTDYIAQLNERIS